MIACVRNNIIIEEPQVAPKTWNDPETNLTYSGFDNLSLEEMFVLGWKVVEDNPLQYDELLEKSIIGPWYYSSVNDVVTRDYVIELLDFPVALTNCFNKLDLNRYNYEVGGFAYDYYGTNVRIFSDRESSQPKLTACQVSIGNGTRLDSDVWKFIKIDDESVIVVQLSNADLLIITNFVFRKIQDSYNLQSYIAGQMLGAGNTENLKLAIENNTINLNPWAV